MPRRTKAPPKYGPAMDDAMYGIEAKIAKVIKGKSASYEQGFTVHTGKKDSKKKPYTGTEKFAHIHEGKDFRLVDDLITALKRELATEPKDKRKPDESSVDVAFSSTAESAAKPTQPSSTFVATDNSFSTINWTIEQFVFANVMKEEPIILSRRSVVWLMANIAPSYHIAQCVNSSVTSSRISRSYNKYNMSPQKSNPQKVSASQVKIWLAKIQTAVRQAGEHEAKIIAGECDTFLPAHQLLSFWYITASRPMGCAAGYQVNLIPNHDQIPGPGLIKDNITVPDGRVVYVSVWHHPEKSPKPVLESIQNALKLDDAEPVLPETPDQDILANSVVDYMGASEAEGSQFSLVADGFVDSGRGIESDAESEFDGTGEISKDWDIITKTDLGSHGGGDSMFSAPATE
ncbi:hypothetical protein FFLO_05288 [Filobasidium floriforme]|uniref:Uncharacterized protein n=1 Tax=Filobasidium floriforme TaxID=5210 RepID=A0A8K0JH46_9TREE|nr:hypothetical protein FFLO_05288 [Filobasidium floriforme]